jgi:hypothetical protein
VTAQPPTAAAAAEGEGEGCGSRRCRGRRRRRRCSAAEEGAAALLRSWRAPQSPVGAACGEARQTRGTVRIPLRARRGSQVPPLPSSASGLDGPLNQRPLSTAGPMRVSEQP